MTPSRRRFDRHARRRSASSRAASPAARGSMGEPTLSRLRRAVRPCGTESSKRSAPCPAAIASSPTFYDGPGWVKFRPWEQGFLILQGGVRRARMEILRHLASSRTARRARARGRDRQREKTSPSCPPDWTVYGVDIARTQLELCRDVIPRWPGGWPGPRPKTCRSTMRRSTPPGRSAASTTTATTSGPARNAPGHQARRPGGRRRRGPRAPSRRPGPSDRHPVVRCLVAAAAGARPRIRGDGARTSTSISSALQRAFGPERTRHRIWHGLGYCLVETSRT